MGILQAKPSVIEELWGLVEGVKRELFEDEADAANLV